MNCDDARPLIHGHLDGELDLVRDLEVERHIDECPRCTREYAALRAMRSRLREEGFRFAAPPELKEKIRRALPAPQPSRGNAYPSRRGPWVTRDQIRGSDGDWRNARACNSAARICPEHGPARGG